jgi:hypothetical protein
MLPKTLKSLSQDAELAEIERIRLARQMKGVVLAQRNRSHCKEIQD